MDLIAERRLAAHTQAATAHERSAEFHAGLAQFFRGRGDDIHATRADRMAEHHARSAMRERIYAIHLAQRSA